MITTNPFLGSEGFESRAQSLRKISAQGDYLASGPVRMSSIWETNEVSRGFRLGPLASFQSTSVEHAVSGCWNSAKYFSASANTASLFRRSRRGGWVLISFPGPDCFHHLHLPFPFVAGEREKVHSLLYQPPPPWIILLPFISSMLLTCNAYKIYFYKAIIDPGETT